MGRLVGEPVGFGVAGAVSKRIPEGDEGTDGIVVRRDLRTVVSIPGPGAPPERRPGMGDLIVDAGQGFQVCCGNLPGDQQHGGVTGAESASYVGIECQVFQAIPPALTGNAEDWDWRVDHCHRKTPSRQP